jgi:hypothetical protein
VAAGHATLIRADVDLEDGHSCATLSLLSALSRVGGTDQSTARGYFVAAAVDEICLFPERWWSCRGGAR